MNNLTTVPRDQGKDEDAEQIQMAALRVSLRTHGPHHPSTQTFMQNFSGIRQLQRREDTDIAESLDAMIDAQRINSN